MPNTKQGFIPASAHNEARRFKSGNFITGEANFTTTRNSFTLLDILGHSFTFTGQQRTTKADNKEKRVKRKAKQQCQLIL